MRPLQPILFPQEDGCVASACVEEHDTVVVLTTHEQLVTADGYNAVWRLYTGVGIRSHHNESVVELRDRVGVAVGGKDMPVCGVGQICWSTEDLSSSLLVINCTYKLSL